MSVISRRWGVAILASLVGCGSLPPATTELPVVNDGGPEVVDGGVQCTAELEAKMSATLAAAPATESFYLELRRDSDGRVFRAYRVISGKSPVTETTQLQSASTAKWIAATVVLDVVANPGNYPGGGQVNGRALTLDSPIKDFLPSWKPTLGTLSASNRLASVTLRQLLAFTSGLEREHACISSTTDPDVCISNLVDANLAENANGSAPRTFYYSGAHLFVAARAAVHASGLGDWGALFKRFKEVHGVFQTPLESPGPAQFGAGGFFPASGAGNSPSPAGAMRYTAGDYTPFLVKLVHGEILPLATVAELFGDEVVRQGVGIEYSPLLDDGEAWHYNLGNWTECASASFSPQCASARRYSSPGSFGTYPFVDFNPSEQGDASFVGLLGYGGTTPGVASTVIALYRTLGLGSAGSRDLAQQWAASSCP
ncbi:MAG: serine hydrolase domain-containing protein [Archangium sp.]|nr:serine hydrolase domain-containing protein [Archangium sp.]